LEFYNIRRFEQFAESNPYCPRGRAIRTCSSRPPAASFRHHRASPAD